MATIRPRQDAKILNICKDVAEYTMNQGQGGPFGAAVVRDGQLIAVASNQVLADNDPTAHGEIVAIRKACKHLGSYDLSGCILYTTAYPCPMCLAAAMWANLDEIVYAGTAKITDSTGFRDLGMYREFMNVGDQLDLCSEHVGTDWIRLTANTETSVCSDLQSAYKQFGKIY